MTPTQKAIQEVGAEITSMLLAKNQSYGNSALDPVRIFSKADAGEQLLVRIDDKLSRIMRGNGFPGDNDLLDLVGYLHLEMVRRKMGENARLTLKESRSMAADEDGWIPWDGHKWSWPDGRSPYDKVIVKTRIGEIWTGFSHEWNWHANNSEDDIIAYKLA